MNKFELQKLPEKGSSTITLRLPSELNKHLEAISKETGISKNAIINKMIIFGIENLKIID